MFGHQGDKDHTSSQQDTTTAPNAAQNGQDGHAGNYHESTVEPTGQHDQPAPSTDTADDSTPAPAPQSDDTWQHPGVPLTDTSADDSASDDSPEPIRDIIAPAGGSAPSFKPYNPDDSGHGSQNDDDSSAQHELIDIKQEALGKLAPLVDQLDQTPEDKFRTTMMMIQASDDQSLIKEAYASANAIEDEKVRAQALLDIVNEINYFTQHPAQE